MGIIPTHSKQNSRTLWEPVISSLKKNFNIHLIPYYTISFEEGIKGLCLGSLDLLNINPAVFQETTKEYKTTPLLFCDFEDGKEDNRTVLVCRRDIDKHYINQTRGLRIAFVDKFSYSGFLIPNQFLAKKISQPLNEWFSTIAYTGSHNQSFTNLVKGKADIIAINYRALKKCMKDNNFSVDLVRILWMSPVLPASIFCSRSDLDEEIRIRISQSFMALPGKKPNIQFSFRPFDSSYVNQIENIFDTNSKDTQKITE